MGKTLFEKIWDEHVVADLGGGASLLHVDRHYLHELCISRGFPTLHERGLPVRNPGLTFATPDHVISSAPGRTGGAFPWSVKVMDTMRIETAKAGIRLFDIDQDGQGILHVIGPELGLTLPGFARSTFYSDSQNDIPLLSAVTHPVATNPNALLAAHATAQGWPILKLFDD